MPPANERLHAHKLRRIALDVEFGLVVNLKLVAVQSALQVVEQTLLKQLLLSHLFVKDNDVLLKVTARHAAGGTRHVEHLHGLQLRLRKQHAHANANACVWRHFLQLVLETVVNAMIIVHMSAEEVESIRTKAPAYAIVLLCNNAQFVTERLEHPVSKVPSVNGIDRMELLDVEHHGIHGHVGLLLTHSVGVLEEVVPVVQPRKGIRLRCRNELLRKLFRPLAAQQEQRNNEYYGKDDCQHNTHVVGNEVREGPLGILCDVVRQRRVNRGVGNLVHDLCQYGIQIRVPLFHRKARVQAHGRWNGCKSQSLALPRYVVVAIATNEHAVCHVICHCV